MNQTLEEEYVHIGRVRRKGSFEKNIKAEGCPSDRNNGEMHQVILTLRCLQVQTDEHSSSRVTLKSYTLVQSPALPITRHPGLYPVI